MRFLLWSLAGFFLALLCFVGLTIAETPIDANYQLNRTHQADVNDFGYTMKITSIGELMQRIMTLMMYLLGSFALLAMIIGGVMMMNAGVDEDMAQKGKGIVISSAIGVGVAMASLIIVTLAQTVLYYFGT